MCIVMGADTATNTQPAASPRRCRQCQPSLKLREDFINVLSMNKASK